VKKVGFFVMDFYNRPPI